MTKRKSKARAVISTILIILLIIVLLLGAFVFIAWRRAGTLAEGLEFRFEYSLSLPKGTLATLIDAADAGSGRLVGETGGGREELELRPDKKDLPFTDIWMDGETMLINVGKLYDYSRRELSRDYSNIESLLPDWPAGEYVDLVRLVALFADEDDFPEGPSDLTPGKIKPILYKSGKTGYVYFRVELGDSGYSVVGGVAPWTVPLDKLSVHAVLEDDNGRKIVTLEGFLMENLGAPNKMPSSIMSEKEFLIARLVIETLQSLLLRER